MTIRQGILEFYSRPVGMTSAGKFDSMLAGLPNDVVALIRIVQGLGVYDVVAPDFYGFNVPDERKNEIHIRPIEEMLDRLLAIDSQPLTVARPPSPISIPESVCAKISLSSIVPRPSSLT